MAKNIDPSLVKIGDYLKLDDDTVFTIPEYQRAYSWNIDNCDKLWQDILDYTESDNKDSYFFGTIIVNCQDNDTKYGLIDGQQRTTTFLLLLKALLLRINTAVITTSNDEDSVSLCRALKERRRRIMSILYKVDVEEIEDKPELVKDKNICGKADLIENYSINEQYKTELNTILKSVEYSEAESSAIKLPRKQKDNKYTNFFRNFKYFYGKCSELSESMVNKIAKSVVENCEVIEIKSWKVEQAIRKDAGIESEEEFYSIVNKLGNKILLEQKINRSIGNEWFRTKVSTKLGDKTGYIDSNYPVAKELVEKYKNDSKPYWKKEDIKLATEKVSDRIIKFIFCE